MVLVFLGSLQFEASKFETRTMPTPDMKGKEMIYWIRVESRDKKVVTNMEHFLKGASQQIDLRVPSAFIAAKVELENSPGVYVQTEKKNEGGTDLRSLEQLEKESNLSAAEGGKTYVIELILRRALPDQPTKQSQSPYG